MQKGASPILKGSSAVSPLSPSSNSSFASLDPQEVCLDDGERDCRKFVIGPI